MPLPPLGLVAWKWPVRFLSSANFSLFNGSKAVLFLGPADIGIEMVQALDAAHAQDIARAQHPSGRLSAVPAELLDGQDRHKLLRAWLRGETGDEE
jgi:hypothetical protein